MIKRFEVQYELGTTPIEKIVIPKSRDELPPVLKALQYIYITPEINGEVFNFLESKIVLKKTGRKGTTRWEILVLAVVRLTLDANYDRLEDMNNHHKLIRDLLGLNTFKGQKRPFYFFAFFLSQRKTTGLRMRKQPNYLSVYNSAIDS